MQLVRFGVIGLGSIGSRHLGYLDTLPGAKLAAVCDAHAPLAQKYSRERSVPAFERYEDLLKSKSVDAIIIATPHFQHPQICLTAFAAGVHVLCEKPLAVSVKQARMVVAAHAASKTNVKFALMLQQRTWPIYAEMKRRLSSGELGSISRISWTITDWFRTDAYYASGGWRATWDGEGGGVLLNQCPHNLDLLWWLTNMMPTRITAVARIGSSHPIEVEDEVSAILEYDGAMGQFTTSTGEAPGTNRLEIATDRGLLISEPSRVTFRRTTKSVTEVRQTGPANTRTVPTCDEVAEFPPEPKDAHKLITQNFVNAILHDEPLLAPGADGVNGLELGNAILLAGLKRQSIDLPLDAEAYEHFLGSLAAKYPGLTEENPDVARAARSLTATIHLPKKSPRKTTTAV